MSLSRLLNLQNNSNFTHEIRSFRTSWNPNSSDFDSLMSIMEQRQCEFYGDIAFYHLPYYKNFLNIDPNVKFVILKRDRQEVINSYSPWTRGRNHWAKHDGKKWSYCNWDHCYPKFNTENKENAIGQYYDLYYQICKEIPEGNCFWIKTEDLNDKEASLQMLKWCGFDDPQYSVFKENRRLK